MYFGRGLALQAGGRSTRIKSEDAAGLVGLVADIDIADEVHKKQGYPPSDEAARE